MFLVVAGTGVYGTLGLLTRGPALAPALFSSFVSVVDLASIDFSIVEVMSLALSTDSACVRSILSRFLILFFWRWSRSCASALSQANNVLRSVISFCS